MAEITIITYSVPKGDDWTVWAIYVDGELEIWDTQRHIEADVTIAAVVRAHVPVTDIRYLGWIEGYGGIKGDTPQELWFSDRVDGPPEQLSEIPDDVMSRAVDYLEQ